MDYLEPYADQLEVIDARGLVERAKSKGLIKAPAAAEVRPKIDASAIAAMVERAKAAGLIREASGDLALPSHECIRYEGVRMVHMTITPDMAAELLQRNVRNRSVSRETVEAYARDMRNGSWVLNGESIKFNRLGELIDGQHRLHAIISAGVQATLFVIYDLPDGALENGMTVMDTVDRGRTRSVADQLRIQHGFKDSHVIASVCASIGGICFTRRTKRLSVAQTLEIYREFKPAIDHVVKHRSKERGLKAAGVLAAFAFAGSALPDEVLKLYTPTMNGTHPQGTALQKLHDWLVSDEALLLTRSADRGLIEVVCGAIDDQLMPPDEISLKRSEISVQRFAALQPDRVAKVAALFELP